MSQEVPPPPAVEMEGAEIAALRDTTLIVLEEVNWTVQAGEFWVVAGPPHSGKSDLLLHAAGLVPPLKGVCRIFGCDTRTFDRSCLTERVRSGFVFADGKLFNNLTIAENVALPLRYHKDAPDEGIAKTVGALLDLLQLTPCASLRPGNVAAVWRHRAALARALALKPEALFLDNPNGGLINRHRLWLLNFLDQLWRGHEFFGGRPMTIVASTDDLRVWEHPKRHFAAVDEGKFSVLGRWGDEPFFRHAAVKELLRET